MTSKTTERKSKRSQAKAQHHEGLEKNNDFCIAEAFQRTPQISLYN